MKHEKGGEERDSMVESHLLMLNEPEPEDAS